MQEEPGTAGFPSSSSSSTPTPNSSIRSQQFDYSDAPDSSSSMRQSPEVSHTIPLQDGLRLGDTRYSSLNQPPQGDSMQTEPFPSTSSSSSSSSLAPNFNANFQANAMQNSPQIPMPMFAIYRITPDQQASLQDQSVPAFPLLQFAQMLSQAGGQSVQQLAASSVLASGNDSMPNRLQLDASARQSASAANAHAALEIDSIGAFRIDTDSGIMSPSCCLYHCRRVTASLPKASNGTSRVSH